MSTANLQAVIQRASSDAQFRDALKDDFASTLRPYELSADEQDQLARAFGVKAGSGFRPMATAMAASADASSVSAMSMDASTADASTADASTADASTADASTADASTADASTADASTADASSVSDL